MSCDVWFKRDIENVLGAVTEGGLQQAQVGASRDYQSGYISAVRQVCLVFGIDPERVAPRRVTVSNPMIYQIEAGD